MYFDELSLRIYTLAIHFLPAIEANRLVISKDTILAFLKIVRFFVFFMSQCLFQKNLKLIKLGTI